jgi:hypothetical protein
MEMNIKSVSIVATAVLALFVGATSASAAIVNIDLAGAVSGSPIVAAGGESFAQTFVGQSAAGMGAPTGPLSLVATDAISVDYWNPGVSAGSNSLLSQPGNAAPLSLLLNSWADAISWTMGYGDGGSVAVDLYGQNGNLVNTASFSELSGYNVFSLSGLGEFYGLTFRSNTDPAGLRFQNFSYNSVTPVSAVPEPETYAMLLLGLGLVGFQLHRHSKGEQSSSSMLGMA